MSEGQATPRTADDVDERIRRAREATRRHERLTHQRRELEQHLEAVRHRLGATEQQFAKEHQDVVRLEQNQFRLNPAQMQQLDRERWEATAAHEQMEGERARLNQLLADRDRMDTQLAQLARAPRDLEHALRTKEDQLRDSGDPRARELDEVTQRVTNVEIALREHVEALNAARNAGPPLGALQNEFGGAATWSKVDMFVSSGWAKRAHLETAAQIAWQAQRELDVLSRELADLGIHAAPRLPVIQTDFFTDILFDNIFTDIKRNDQINQAIAQIDGVGRWLHDTVQWLDGRCVEIDRELTDLRARRDSLLATGG